MISLILNYFFWHYTRALTDIVGIFKNIFTFEVRFFSIPLLLKTLFSPWQKQNESYVQGFHPGAFFETFIVNIITRLVGFVIRVCFIIIGIVCLVFTVVLFLTSFVIWLVLPFIITILFFSGIRLLFKNNL